ncbi:MAG: SRPBCC domain-containing protein [Bacteroidia bacterium]|nr:SRPBCC domain-containing protein [Bacteroidia bacterium]
MKNLILILSLLLCKSGFATVVDSASNGFTVQTIVEINATSTQVYDALVRDVDRWWDPAHSYSQDASNFYIEPRANGCFCEQLPNGGSVLHMIVSHVNPGKTLVLLGGMGPLQGMGLYGSMTFSLEEKAGKTQLTVTYVVTGYTPGGLQSLASPVDQVLAGQMARLKTFVEGKK